MHTATRNFLYNKSIEIISVGARASLFPFMAKVECGSKEILGPNEATYFVRPLAAFNYPKVL